MSMVVQHNISAINANRMLGGTSKAQAKSTEKLSSGYRINRAADDAAGLAISEKMRAQVRGLTRASLNAQDGISLVQTAEGALNESQNIMQRMRELAVQAANETATDEDRENIQLEINQLTDEINRIGNTTEFNTKKLLMGKTDEAKKAYPGVEILNKGIKSETVGSVSDLIEVTKSKEARMSVTTLSAGSADTTGEFSNIITQVQGVESARASASLLGVTFEAATVGTSANGWSIELKSLGRGSVSGADDVDFDNTSKKLTIKLSEETVNSIETVSDFDSKIGELLKTGGATAGQITQMQTVIPEGVNSSENISEKLKELVSDTSRSEKAVFSGGLDGKAGVYKIKFDKAFSEEGDTLTVSGYTFRAVSAETAASPTSSFSAYENAAALMKAAHPDEFELVKQSMSGSPTDAQVVEFAISHDTPEVRVLWSVCSAPAHREACENARAALSEEFRLGTASKDIDKDLQGSDISVLIRNKLGKENVSVVYEPDNGYITITELAGKEGQLKIDKAVTTKGAGENEVLTIADDLGQNLQVEFKIATSGTKPTAVYTGKSGTDATGKITITLIKGALNNSAEEIENAIINATEATAGAKQADGVNLSGFHVTGNTGWEEAIVWAYLDKDWSTMTGGIKSQEGLYQFDLTKMLEAGETLRIGGQEFKAVESGADALKGEFNIGKDIASQLSNLQNAFNNNAVLKAYDVTIDGAKVTLKEQTASGGNLAAKGISVSGNDTMGRFIVDTDSLLSDGASITIDGQKIDVSSKNQHVGYDAGTAIKVSEKSDDQTKAIADAVNKNAVLREKYEAAAGEDGKLLLTQKIASEKEPDVFTTTSTKGSFELRLQIGANAGQAMTIDIGDNRALALGLSGDGSTNTVMAGDGKVAYYSEVKNVNNGSDNENVEYSLDITSHEKASAATSVIDDALNAVSKQRAVLGAAQNRLEHTIANLDNTAENLTTAESAIRDTDMASEMVDFSKNSILIQAGQSMLSQANQSNQGILSLIQ